MLAVYGGAKNLDEFLLADGQVDRDSAAIAGYVGFSSMGVLSEEMGEKLTYESPYRNILSLHPSCFSGQQKIVFSTY